MPQRHPVPSPTSLGAMAHLPPNREILLRSTSLRVRRDPSNSTLHCYCGSIDCVFLKKNCSILETVEKDVHTAAQLGQALLARHEAYMADAERDRLELTTRIGHLEKDKLDLETFNANKVEENQCLLDQLEALNNTVSDSDTKIKALESNLISSHQTVRRLEAAEARASDAEHHIAVLEEEQGRLHYELRSTKDDDRTHAQRFKETQRGILDMQYQLERMEEARREHERHAEVVGRMERQREMEKQLGTAVGRFKAAAATRSLQEQANGTKIVGHFVRDLLEDNANLQLGIAELREMLISSNDEIQLLRDQLMHHQPMAHNTAPPTRTLQAELGPILGVSRMSQELHIHHHYRATARKPELKKPKKRRQGLPPGAFTPSVSLVSPPPRTSSIQWGPGTSPAAPVTLSPGIGGATLEALSNPSKPRHSWGGCSNSTSELSSSAPSSPPSAHTSSLFDVSLISYDNAMSPTTSFDPTSPTWRASQSKRTSAASCRSFQSMSSSLLDPGPDTPCRKHHMFQVLPEQTIHEEDEDDTDMPLRPPVQAPKLAPDHMTSTDGSSMRGLYCFIGEATPRLRLLRTSSHESIISLDGGLDIHTLKSRPSQMTLRPLGGADAVVTGVTARPTLSHAFDKKSDAVLRSHVAGLDTLRSVSSPAPQPLSPPAPHSGSSLFGRWVGWRPWGTGSRLCPKGTDNEKEKDVNRVPGINQPGAIPGFQKHCWDAQKRKGAPAKVTAETVDRDALTEGLQE